MKILTSEQPYTPRTRLLVNGEMVVFRLLKKTDESLLRDFFSSISEKDVRFLRHNVHDPAIISFWIENLDHRQVLPLIALNESSDRIAGAATLHFMKGVNRHIAGIRIVVGSDYRNLGLGSAMLKELTQIGTELGLYFIRAEILAQNQLAIKAFRQLGFETKCTLEDHFMTQDGETFDMVFMLKRLLVNMEEDFFFVF